MSLYATGVVSMDAVTTVKKHLEVTKVMLATIKDVQDVGERQRDVLLPIRPRARWKCRYTRRALAHPVA